MSDTEPTGTDGDDSGGTSSVPRQLQRPGRPGHCTICDAPVPGTRWFCDEHQGARKTPVKNKPIGRKAPARGAGKHYAGERSRTAERLAPSAPKPPSEARSRVAQVGRVSDAAATSTLSKLLIILCVIFVHYRLRAASIPDPTGERAENLSPSNQQARDMVAPIARWGNATPLGARVIAPVVRNEDIVLAVYAWWEWQRSVSRFVEENRRGRLAPVQPFRPGGAGEPSEFRAADQVVMPEAPMAPDEVRFDPSAPPAPGGVPWA